MERALLNGVLGTLRGQEPGETRRIRQTSTARPLTQPFLHLLEPFLHPILLATHLFNACCDPLELPSGIDHIRLRLLLVLHATWRGSEQGLGPILEARWNIFSSLKVNWLNP